jgi:formate hydrogenlyase subunit 3/multisubunit Na+/H+ antiporter MnhD subunit
LNAPIILLVGTGLLAILVFRMRESPVWAGAIAAFGMGCLGLFVIVAPIEFPVEVQGFSVRFGSTLEVLGRSIALRGAARPQVAFLYLFCAYFFIGSIADQPGRYFHSAATLCLLMLVISLMVEPFLFASIFLVLAAMCAVVILTSSMEPARWGSLQLLILYTLAMMAILITGWMLENIGVTASTASIAQRAIVLLGLGFAILLIIPPFHFWLPSSATRINFFVLAFIALIFQTSGQFFLYGFFEAYSWMRLNPMVQNALLLAGGIVFVGGGLFALAQIQLEKFLAYVLIAGFGFSLLTICSSLVLGSKTSLGLIATRIFFIASLALGVSIRQKILREDREAHGKVGNLVLASIAVGILSLVGFPPLGDFSFKWSTIADFSVIDIRIVIVLVSGITILFIGSARWIVSLSQERPSVELEPSYVLGRLDRSLILFGIIISMLVGVFPQLVYPWVRSVVSGLQNIFG